MNIGLSLQHTKPVARPTNRPLAQHAHKKDTLHLSRDVRFEAASKPKPSFKEQFLQLLREPGFLKEFLTQVTQDTDAMATLAEALEQREAKVAKTSSFVDLFPKDNPQLAYDNLVQASGIMNSSDYVVLNKAFYCLQLIFLANHPQLIASTRKELFPVHHKVFHNYRTLNETQTPEGYREIAKGLMSSVAEAGHWLKEDHYDDFLAIVTHVFGEKALIVSSVRKEYEKAIEKRNERQKAIEERNERLKSSGY